MVSAPKPTGSPSGIIRRRIGVSGITPFVRFASKQVFEVCSLLHSVREKGACLQFSSTRRFILRRVLTSCIAGIVGSMSMVSVAQAAPASEASESVDRIFAETFPENRDVMASPAGENSQPAAPEPRPAPVVRQEAQTPRPAAQSSISSPPAPTAAPAATQPAPSRPAPAANPAPAPQRAPATGTVRRVSSTAYCLTGRMASGKFVYSGAAAMNGVPLGSRYRVLDGPRAGATFTIEDRIGHSSGFDIAYPGNCGAARQYGRRTISIQQV